MKKIDLSTVKTLQQFNDLIRMRQEEAHGKDYCQIHDAIEKYMSECTSYMELGTNQGGTASVAMLCKPNRVYLVDLDMSKFREYLQPIAVAWCNQHNIELIVKEIDSTSIATINDTDMLVIDSYHHPDHMRKELKVHSPNVHKYIIAHDTNMINGRPNDSLYQCLKNFAIDNNWEIIERGITNVGYTVLRRT